MTEPSLKNNNYYDKTDTPNNNLNIKTPSSVIRFREKIIFKAIDKISTNIRCGRIKAAKLNLIINSSFKDEIINSTKVSDACKERLGRIFLYKGSNGLYCNINDARPIITLLQKFGAKEKTINDIVNSDEVTSALTESVYHILAGNFRDKDFVKEILMFAQELKMEKHKELLEDLACSYLFERENDLSIEIISFMKTLNEFNLKNFKDKVHDFLIERIHNLPHYISRMKDFINNKKENKDKISVIEDIIDSEEIIDACKKGLGYCISNSYFIHVKYIVSFLKVLKKEKKDDLIKDIMNSEEIIKACSDCLIRNVLNARNLEDTEDLISFIQEYNIPESKIKVTIDQKDKESIIDSLCHGLFVHLMLDRRPLLNMMPYFRRFFVIPEDKVKDIIINACKKNIVDALSIAFNETAEKFISFIRAQEIEGKEDIIKDMMSSEEVLNACAKGVTDVLRGDTQYETYDHCTIFSFIKEQGINEKEIIKRSEIIRTLMQNLNCSNLSDLLSCDKEQLNEVLKKYDESWQDKTNVIVKDNTVNISGFSLGGNAKYLL